MTPTDKLKIDLIDKIRLIQDDGFLRILNNLVAHLNTDDIIQLTAAEEELLQLSENDIKAGRLVSQIELEKMDQEWFKER